MQQYRISEESFKKFRKKWFNVGIPMISGVVVIFIVILIYYPKQDDEFNTLPYVIPILLALITFSIFRGLKRQRQLLMSYSITISDDEITRDQYNTPPLTISFMEIKEITKAKKGNLIIKGRTRMDVIYISYLIDNIAELEEDLKKFAPITTNPKESLQRKFKIVLSLLMLAAFFALVTANNKVTVGISGVVAGGAFIYRFVALITNKSIPVNMKRRSWVNLLLVAFVIYMMYTKLTAPGY